MGKVRYVVLDALRGIALLGICLANFSEFSLYSFLPEEATGAMPTAAVDGVVRFLQLFLVDGKFYTLFSLLFGIGFSIILTSYAQKGGGWKALFYRRMVVLLLIGLAHLLLLWAGDILILYAALGMLLPLFRKLSDRALLTWAAALLLAPVGVDALVGAFGWELSAPAVRTAEYFHARAGITWETFPVWLAEKETYLEVLQFNLAGSFIRLQEFIDGNRAFKVMGLFLLGLYIGRHRLYARLEEIRPLLLAACRYGFGIGLPASLAYAWNGVSGYPLGLAGTAAVSAVSVVTLGIGYMAAFCLWYVRRPDRKIFAVMAAPGRMALTNYILQSAFGMAIFYGVGFGWGAKVGLVYVELIAAAVFAIQVLYSYGWLHFLQYGPLEWVWRMLTYGTRLKLTK